jgi:hypothetical protein
MESPPNEEREEWLQWDFQCLMGYKAHVNVGLRTLEYGIEDKDGEGGKGRDFFLVPELVEDIWGERWVMGGRWWC